MITNKILVNTIKCYILISFISLFYVSIMGIFSPQQVMELVRVSLTNTDAISSIRGVYGGVGFTISCLLLFLFFKKPEWAHGFLILFWGSYALSRILTILMDGKLGDFGANWLLIESLLCVIGLFLLIIKNILTKSDEMIYLMVDQGK
ncbi:DUF4345 domain-containing protein [Belliella pelovolcani]|uniref:DUF4345 domain-containing protein n=1 Tax=Belliella pelovolcani TaxID=529505 RepID=A0A1N7NVL5_9BACT|nr:DUF4345 domain-containing protein [Belliella pelovolcani]SIT02425.1 protein of unknown function [Belliella pelovolcani]